VSKWLYPNKEIIKRWVELLEQPTFILSPYLPPIDDGWLDAIENSFESLKFDFYPEDFYYQAASIFYKICKNHYFVDSNKRSSLIVLYLFCVINGYTITCSPEAVKKLAENTAMIEGSSNHKQDIQNIESTLKTVIVAVVKKT
jgi:death-on-curing family protein